MEKLKQTLTINISILVRTVFIFALLTLILGMLSLAQQAGNMSLTEFYILSAFFSGLASIYIIKPKF